LIADEDQELETHLRKRHASARRLSNMALMTQQQQAKLLQQQHPQLASDQQKASVDSNLSPSYLGSQRRESGERSSI
jgi:hypothetical protein